MSSDGSDLFMAADFETTVAAGRARLCNLGPSYINTSSNTSYRLTPYTDLMMAWLAITLFRSTISLLSCVLITTG